MKTKMMQVPVFKKGDKVQHLVSKKVGTVYSQKGIKVRLQGYAHEMICTEFRLLSKKEYENLLPKKLKVSTLNREIIFANDKFIVGCQTISKSDAKKIASFITKYAK